MSAATTTPHTPWPTVKLGDVCEVARGGSPRPIRDYITDDPEGLNWIKIGDISPNGKYIESTSEKITPAGLTKTRRVFAGDFLLSNSMSFGRPYILKIDGCIHDGWLVLKGFKNVLEENFFYYLLKSELVQTQFELLAHGSTVRNLNTKAVEDVVIPLPPLDEQQRIVDRVEQGLREADGLAEHFKRLATLADDTFKAELDETFNALSAPTVKLGDVARINGGFAFKSENYVDHGVRVIRISDFNELGFINDKIVRHLYDETLSSYVLELKDILLCMTGGTVGKSLFITMLDEKMVTNQRVATIKVKQALPEYVYQVILSSKVKEIIQDSKNSTNDNISMGTIKDFPIPLPSLDIQREIVGKLETAKVRCERLKVEAERGLKAAEALRKAVLVEAFEQ